MKATYPTYATESARKAALEARIESRRNDENDFGVTTVLPRAFDIPSLKFRFRKFFLTFPGNLKIEVYGQHEADALVNASLKGWDTDSALTIKG